MRRSIAAGLIALTLGFCLPTAALANDGSVGSSGGSVKPIDNEDIRMDSEAVQILCMRDYAMYRVDFKFVNESTAPVKVKLGFPFPDFTSQEENVGEAPGAFMAWHDGKPLPVKQEKGTDTNGEDSWPVIWFTHETEFPVGESMVTVSYLASPDSMATWGGLDAGVPQPEGTDGNIVQIYPYIVHTGAGWKGPIAKSVVRYKLGDDFNGSGVEQVLKNWTQLTANELKAPERAKHLASYSNPTPTEYVWTYEDYEPTVDHDTALPFMRWYYPTEGPEASSELELGDKTYPAWNAADGQPGTAWAESADGPGTDQWVKVTFDDDQPVKQIRVLPGYQKSEELFKKYNRPKTLRVDFSDGSSQEVQLKDRIGLQTFDANVAEARTAKVTILDVYPGTNDRDETYLSEITFAEADMPLFKSFEDVTGIEAPAGYSNPTELEQFSELPAPVMPPEPIDSDASEEAGAESERVDRVESQTDWLPYVLGTAVLGSIVFLATRKPKTQTAPAEPFGEAGPPEFAGSPTPPLSPTIAPPTPVIILTLPSGLPVPVGPEPITIGRSSSSRLVVSDPKASSAHAQVFIDGEVAFLVDMNSTNGTALNGVRIEGPVTLKDGDAITIGDTQIAVTGVSSE